MTAPKVKATKATGNAMNVTNFGKFAKLMKDLGQLMGARYDKIEKILSISVNDPSIYLDVEAKETNDGREFYVLHFCNPANRAEKYSLPISGDESAELFEVHLCEANSTFEANGKTIKKGTRKIRCYAVTE